MRKQFLIKIAAVLCCGAAAASILTACEQKKVALDNEQIVNFTEPAQDEEICVLTVKDYGDIKIKFFPEETSQGVENFKGLVKKGFYDELIFHRIINQFMIQGGDPKGDGTGGVDANGGNGFKQTISSKLIHVPGALAYAINPQEKLNKSQFYIVTGTLCDTTYMDTLASKGYKFSPFVRSIYEQFGGAPHLDGGYEIFGQVFDGMDKVMQIQKVAVDSNDKPRTSVVIEKAELVKYDGSGTHWVNYLGEEQSGINAKG